MKVMFSDYARTKFERPDVITFKSPFSNPKSRWHPQASKFSSDGDKLSRGVPPVREGDELRRKLEGRRILA